MERKGSLFIKPKELCHLENLSIYLWRDLVGHLEGLNSDTCLLNQKKNKKKMPARPPLYLLMKRIGWWLKGGQG